MTLEEIKNLKYGYTLYYDEEKEYNLTYGNFDTEVEDESDIDDFVDYVNTRLYLYNNFKISCKDLRDEIISQLEDDFNITLKNKKFKTLDEFISKLISLYNTDEDVSDDFINFLKMLQSDEITIVWYLKDKYIPTVESWNDHLAPNDKDIEYKHISYKDIFTKDEVFGIDLSECDRIYSKHDLFKYL